MPDGNANIRINRVDQEIPAQLVKLGQSQVFDFLIKSMMKIIRGKHYN